MKIKLSLIILAVAVAGVFATYKVEIIGETCERTGATRHYNRYFYLYSTQPIFEPSWIDEIITASGQPEIEHSWIRTQGDTSTIISFYRAHQRAPLTYHINNETLEALLERFTEQQVLELALDFASGVPERQEAAFSRYQMR